MMKTFADLSLFFKDFTNSNGIKSDSQKQVTINIKNLVNNEELMDFLLKNIAKLNTYMKSVGADRKIYEQKLFNIMSKMYNFNVPQQQ